MVSDFPDACVYEKVEAHCAAPSIETVYIATPHQFHTANVRAAAAAGKHMLVEKSMAREDCQVMVEAARKARMYLLIGQATAVLHQLSARTSS